MAVSQLIGASIKRREDPELVTGTGNFVDDEVRAGLLHMFVLRSSQAHARITGIDTVRAKEADGVVAIFTGKDLAAEYKAPLPVTVSFVPEKKYPPQYPIATDKVRYVGEPVAVVVALSRAAAEDAAERIDVRYEPLPPVLDIEKAIAKDAPVLDEELGTNLAYDVRRSGGDIDAAFREADVRIKQRLQQQRLIPVAIEPRGVLAEYKQFAGTLTVWSSTQIPHFLKIWLGVILGIPESQVRVIAPDVGGGFGSKIHVYPEEVLAAQLARRLGQAVKWVEDRNENMVATTHGRAQIWDVEIAAKKDGRLLGVRATQYLDLGAYCSQFGSFQSLALLVAQGPYKLAAFDGRGVGVFTNKTPTDAYRGAGRPEATFMIERVMDLVARETGVDPVEVRRRNFVPAAEQPFTNLLGLTYDSGDYNITLDKALTLSGYRELRTKQAEMRKQGRYLGIGLCTYLEICGLGPSIATTAAAGVGFWGMSVVNLHFTGKATVIIGSSPHGQGHETPFAQVVADVLGLPLEDIDVVHGDTAVGPMGMDTYGSRSASVDGASVYMSAVKVRDKARKIAAHLLEAAEEDVVYEGGKAFVKGTPSRSISLQEVVMAAYQPHRLPEGMEGGLEATTFFNPPNFVWPFGAHVCVVEVDAETGAAHIVRYVAIDDCGTRLNPLIVEGQVHGGIAQGIGQALLEEGVYGEDGQLKSGSLVDYMVPTAADLPGFETGATVTPSPTNPLGVKGIGEAGTIASSAAVVNAVVDALSPFGVRDVAMPASPQRLWQLMHKNGGRKEQ